MNSTKDIVGGMDMTIQLNGQLASDRFNNSNAAVVFNTGYGSVPSGYYFDPSTGFTIMAWVKPLSFQFFGFERISISMILYLDRKLIIINIEFFLLKSTSGIITLITLFSLYIPKHCLISMS